VATGRGVTISNDGATIMKLLEIEHPAAKTLVDVSMSQDSEVGDGTTSVVLLSAEILTKMKPFIEENVHPQIISSNIRTAGLLAVLKIKELSINFIPGTNEQREMLLKTASTALNSKLIANHKDLFAPMIVDAVLSLQNNIPTGTDTDTIVDKQQPGSALLANISNYISIKQIPGGDVRQSFLVNGVAFKKTFSYAGFEQMNKKYLNPKILLLNVELELKSEKENAEVRISNPSEYQSIVDAEWKVIYDKLDACVACGANIVLSRLPIGDLATQYFADRGLFCAGRVQDNDLKRVAKATGASVQTSTVGLNTGTSTSFLGQCGVFEEKRVGEERFNIFTDCPERFISTIVLRGGTEQFIAESERSVHDALMVVKRSVVSNSIVPGGGAIEMEISSYLRNYSLSIEGKGQLIISAYAKALEVIPRQLCDNAGFDSTDILSALRKKHATVVEKEKSTNEDDGKFYGVDVVNGTICNTYETGVWEPSDNKINSFQAATEAACVILSIDETIISPSSQDPGGIQHSSGMIGGGQGGGGGGGGRPMSNIMNNAMAATQGGARTGQLGPGVSYMKGRGGG
jgi:T-complex protein 1 subunit eta